MVACLRNVQHGVGRGCLAARQQQCSGATLERRDALLGDVLRGVRDARVDRAQLGEREAVCRLLGAVEDERGGLMDGQRTRCLLYTSRCV